MDVCNADVSIDSRFSVAERTLEPAVAHWLRSSRAQSLPSFYLWESTGCNSSIVRSALRERFASQAAEAVLPEGRAQYLIDYHLMEAIERDPRRVHDPSQAQWHFVAAAPFASHSAGLIGLLGGPAGHRKRMDELGRCLESIPQWKQRRQPFFLLQPWYRLHDILGGQLSQWVLRRHTHVAPVFLGVVDRTHGRTSAVRYRTKTPSVVLPFLSIYARAIELPYVATPSLALHAQRCRADADGGGGVGGRHDPADDELPCRAAAARHGFMFHGDTGRWDFGTRGAVRDMAPFLRRAAPVSMRTATMTRGAMSWHRARNLSSSSAGAMVAASVCFAPQGDTMTTRRLFDALAAGCVPVVLKAIGGGRTEIVLGNLPFHHTLDWRALALFLLPRRLRQTDRERPAWGARLRCREDEAAWLAAHHSNASLMRTMRSAARAAFIAHLDVQYHPSGVVEALLRELTFVDETPAFNWWTHPVSWLRSAPLAHLQQMNLLMPPRHVLRPGAPVLETLEDRVRRRSTSARAH